MILRKPYAFFIKNFKFMHFIMTIVLSYLFIKTLNIYNFFSEYLGTVKSYVGLELTDGLFSIFMFIMPIIIIIVSILIMSVLQQKKKPSRFYIINIVVAIFVIGFYYYTYNVIGDMEVKVLDVRLIRGVKDFVFALLVIQLVSILITFARASGFDIKKFDFQKDLASLEIKETDREEFELNLEIDTDKIIRKIRRFIRYSKYIYKENVLMANAIILIIGLIITSIYLIDKNIYNKTYANLEYFNTSKFRMRVTASYITREDSKNNIIVKDDKSLVLVSVEVKRRFKETIKLNLGEMALRLGSKLYYPTDSYRDKISDVGEPYFDQEITPDFKTYLLVYEVPTKHLKRKQEFNYVKKVASARLEPNFIHISIDPINLDKDKNVIELEEETKMKDSILNNSILHISGSKIGDSFINEYNYCLNKTCYKSKEYIRPKLNTNYNKKLIKLNVNYKFDKESNSTSFSFERLVNNYLFIEYKKDNKWLEQKEGINVLKPKNSLEENVYYLEVNEDIGSSEEAYLTFKVRNQTYKYKLLGGLE